MDRASTHMAAGPRLCQVASSTSPFGICSAKACRPAASCAAGRPAAPKTLPLYHSITCVEPDEMARMARDALRTPVFSQFQVEARCRRRLAGRRRPADASVREAVGDGPVVYGDWNCGADTARRPFASAGRWPASATSCWSNPARRMEDCAAAKAATGLPMKLDEARP